MPTTKSEQKEGYRPKTNKKKRFLNTSNVSASSNANETNQKQNNNGPLAECTHEIWNCPIFKNMNVTNRYAAVRKERLCYGCLRKGHAIKDLRTEKVPITIKGLHSKVHSLEVFAHPSISLENTTNDYKGLKKNFQHLNVLTNTTFNLMEVGIILGQDAYEIQRPLDPKIGTQSEPFAVLTELGCVVSGPMTGKKRQNVCHFASTEAVKVAEKIQPW